MPEMPEGTDRNRLVVVRPKDVPENTPAEQIPEHVVGAAYVLAFPDDVEFVRFDGETAEQAEAREKAAAAVQVGADQVGADQKPAKQSAPVDRFAQQ